MEVQPDILAVLLCSVCDGYLSCAPIRMKNNGDKLCGRCSDPEDEPTLRNTSYEELAKMVVFPCSNQEYGCRETLYMAQMKDHEEGCEYRQYGCPVADSGQCDWSGSKKDILDHCTEHHPDNVLQQPFTIPHRINESYRKTFVLATLEMLFIVHCKVCTTSRTIYHSVRLLDKAALATNYKYKLEVLNNDDKLVRSKDVAPQGCMALQAHTAVQLDFKTMLHFLGDFKDIMFKLTVGPKCVKCAWHTDKGWYCKDCAPARRARLSYTRGCTYTNMEDKIMKRERYQCTYNAYCIACERNVPGLLRRHYRYTHSDTMYKAGTSWRTQADHSAKYCLISSDVGILQCCYYAFSTKFKVYIRSPMRREQLSKYRCMIQLMNSVTGCTVRETPALCYDKNHDWILECDNDKLLMCGTNDQIDIKIVLNKV